MKEFSAERKKKIGEEDEEEKDVNNNYLHIASKNRVCYVFRLSPRLKRSMCCPSGGAFLVEIKDFRYKKKYPKQD